MRMLGRLKIKGGWNHTAKHIPGLRNTLADGISRWPRALLADKVRELTNSDDWSEQDIGTRGKGIFDTVLQTKNILSKDDDCQHNERRTTRLIRVREGYVPRSTYGMHFCCVHCSILLLSTVHTRPCMNRGQQGRTQGRGSAISLNARVRFSREE